MLKILLVVLVSTFVLFQCVDDKANRSSSGLLYDVTAPDGSKHYMLGTMHLGVGIDDISTETLAALQAADVYVAEITMEQAFQLGNMFQDENRSDTQQRHRLSNKLGGQYWQALRRQLPDVSEQELDSMTAADVQDKMLSLLMSDMEQEKMLLDLQISEYGETQDKEVIGLDDHIAADLMMQAMRDTSWDIDTLQKAILCGGMPCLEAGIAKLRTAWLRGNLVQMEALIETLGFSQIGQDWARDRAWFDSGIVQNHCQHDRTCVIYVGAAHLFENHGSFATILRQNGYTIEKNRR